MNGLVESSTTVRAVNEPLSGKLSNSNLTIFFCFLLLALCFLPSLIAVE